MTIKKLSLYLIPYLTICGALYNIAYWDIFNLDGLSLISITDVIKSSVYPVFTILLAVLYNLTIQNLILPSTADGTIKPVLKKGISNTNLLIVYMGINLALSLVLYWINYSSPNRFMWFGLINALFPSIYLINNNFLAGQFPSERLRRLVIDIIVFVPVVAFYTGKYKGELVLKNIKYKYCITEKQNGNKLIDTIKYIGNTDKFFIYTDMKNSKIIFIKSDKVDTLILYDKK